MLRPARPAPAPVPVEDVLDRLEAVRRNGEGRWMARCPAHGDRTASLSVRLGDDGRILLHCFSGCEFSAILGALNLEPRQLFPAADKPWTPRRPKPNPDGEAWALVQRLRVLHRPPEPARMRQELALVGGLLAGGTRAFAELPRDFRSPRIQTFALRLVFEAMAELAAQGTPRRWFGLLAVVREIDRWAGAGYARRLGIPLWCRMAVGAARGTE